MIPYKSRTDATGKNEKLFGTAESAYGCKKDAYYVSQKYQTFFFQNESKSNDHKYLHVIKKYPV